MSNAPLDEAANSKEEGRGCCHRERINTGTNILKEGEFAHFPICRFASRWSRVGMDANMIGQIEAGEGLG